MSEQQWKLIVNYEDGVFRVVDGDETIGWTSSSDEYVRECLQRVVNRHNREIQKMESKLITLSGVDIKDGTHG